MTDIRKIITLREVIFAELGHEAPRPIVRAVGIAVIRNPFARPRALWQRYRGQRVAAQHAFWWPHAPVGAIAAGARLVIALPLPAIVRWGRDGWLAVADVPTVDTGLGFHAAVLETAALTPGSWIDFTWRWQDSGEWADQDCRVEVRAATRPGAGSPDRLALALDGENQ